ncbi:MAG: YgjV family protein [Rhodospirillaceae bacterium]|jgi:hypothetical protein|nr:YgjV family protein [Rhodospirillaceae bacterium]
MMDIFSLAQCAGYCTFVFGILACWQKNDRYFKIIITFTRVSYAVHFFLLDNPSACVISLIIGLRSLLAAYTRSLLVMTLMLVLSIVAGWFLSREAFNWIPVIATCIATVAFFRMNAIPMRITLLSCSLLWLVNNIMSGSVGGTLLEVTLAVVNIITILRMLREAKKIKLEIQKT